MPIQRIKRAQYQKFLNEFGANKAKETVDKVHRHIRSCVHDALEDQIIRFDFTRKTKPTFKVPAKKSTEKHLDYHESDQLLKTIRSRTDRGLGYSLLLLILRRTVSRSYWINKKRLRFQKQHNHNK